MLLSYSIRTSDIRVAFKDIHSPSSEGLRLEWVRMEESPFYPNSLRTLSVKGCFYK